MTRRICIFAISLLCSMIMIAQATPKKGLKTFIDYLKSDKQQLNYVSFEQKAQNDQVEVRVICREDTQQKLIDVIGGYAAMAYAFEKSAAGEIVFIAQFPQEKKGAATSPAVTKCPGSVKVTTWKAETVQFDEYVEMRGTATLPKITVNSAIAGVLKEWNVAVGGQVRNGELMAIIVGASTEEIAKLADEVKKAENILKARKNWKVPSEKAIQQAEQKYQELLAQYEQKKTIAAFPVTSTCSGTVLSIAVPAGQTVAVGAPLIELENDDQPEINVMGADDDLALFSQGERVSVRLERTGSGFQAAIAQVSAGQMKLVVDSANGRIQKEDPVVFRKLKKHHDEVVLLSSEWIRKDEIGTFVYLVDIREARLRYVTTGSSENGKTMVSVGIAKGNEIITSGFECLRDGKKIKVLTPSTGEAVTKPISKPAEKPTTPVVKEPKPKQEPKVKADTVSEEKEQTRFRVGLTFGRFTVSDKNLSEFYGHSWQNVPGIEAAVHIEYNVDIWASYKVYSQKTESTVFENSIKFRISPFLLGAIYRPKLKNAKRFEPYVGAGLNFYAYSEKIEGETDLENTKGSAVGFHFQGGTYIHIWKSLYGGAFFRVNIVNKTLTEVTPDEVEQLKLGGVEYGIGFFYRF